MGSGVGLTKINTKARATRSLLVLYPTLQTCAVGGLPFK